MNTKNSYPRENHGSNGDRVVTNSARDLLPALATWIFTLSGPALRCVHRRALRQSSASLRFAFITLPKRSLDSLYSTSPVRSRTSLPAPCGSLTPSLITFVLSLCLSVCLSLALLLYHLPLPPFFVRTVLSALHQATSPSPRTALGERHPVSTGQGHEGFSGGMADISIVSLTRSVDVLLHGRVLSPFDSEQGVSQHKPCMWAAAALQARAVCMPALGLYLCQALAP